MSKITYSLRNGIGEWTTYAPVRNKMLEIVFPSETEGKLKVGDKCFSVSRGITSFKLSDIYDGTHFPILYTSKGRYLLEGIKKEGDLLEPLPTNEETIRRMISRIYELELKCALLEKQVVELDTAINRRLNF